MSFNTFVQHIKSESFLQLGFWKFNKTGIPCSPIHWFQFADDAAVISSQEKENQIILIRFSVWCQWANMIICVDKCSTLQGDCLSPLHKRVYVLNKRVHVRQDDTNEGKKTDTRKRKLQKVKRNGAALDVKSRFEFR